MKNIKLILLSLVVLILVSCNDELKINSINVYPDEITLLKGDSIRISATIDFVGGEYNEPGLIKLNWSSDNKEVLSVDSTGFIRTHAIGVANVILTCADKSSHCHVTVVESDSEVENLK